MRFALIALLAISSLHSDAVMADEPRLLPLTVGNVYTFPGQEYGPRQLKVLRINSTTVDVHDLTFNMNFSLPIQAFDNRPGITTETKPSPQVAWKSLEASAQRENPIQPVAHTEPAKLDENQPWPGDIFVLRDPGVPPRQIEVVRTEPGSMGGSVTQVRDRKTGEVFPIPTSTLVDMIRMSMAKAPQTLSPSVPKLNVKAPAVTAIQTPTQKLELPPQHEPPREVRTDKPVTLFNTENPKPSLVPTQPKLAIAQPAVVSPSADQTPDESQPWAGDTFILRAGSQTPQQVEVLRVGPASSDNGMSPIDSGMTPIDSGMTMVRDTGTGEEFSIQTSVLVEMIQACKDVKPEAVVAVAPKSNAAILVPSMKLELPEQIAVATVTPEPSRDTVVATSTQLPAHLQNVPILVAQHPTPSIPPTSSAVVQTTPMQQTPQQGFGAPYATAARFNSKPSGLPSGMPRPDEVAALLEPERTPPMSVNHRPIASTSGTELPPLAHALPTQSTSVSPQLAIKTEGTPETATPTLRQPSIAVIEPQHNIQPASLSSPVARLYTAHASPKMSSIRPLSRSGVAQMRQEIGPMLYEMGHALRPSLRQRAVSIVAYGRFGWRPEVQHAIAEVAVNDPAPEVRAFCIATLSNLGYDDTEYLSHLVQWAESPTTDVVQQTAYSAYSKLSATK